MAQRKQKPDTKRKQEFISTNEVIEFLKHSPILYSRYQVLDEEWRKRFLDFCEGKKTLPLGAPSVRKVPQKPCISIYISCFLKRCSLRLCRFCGFPAL